MIPRAFLAPPVLTTAIEIASHRVSAIRLGEQGGRPTVLAHAVAMLPPGVVVPSLTGTNVTSRDTLVAAIAQVIGALGGRTSRAGLIVPDPIAKVSLMKFEKVPTRDDDLEQLVRWQVKKTAPFQIEEAQLSFSKGATSADGGIEFVVALARRMVIEEYESACAAAGVHAGLVDLATFNIVNAVQAAGDAEAAWLLVAVAPTYTTIAIVRAGHLIFFRSRPEGEGSLLDLVHQTVMYYEDRLEGRGFTRILLSGAESDGETLLIRQELEGRLGVKVDPVDPGRVAALSDHIAADASNLGGLTPLVGLLLRARAA